MDNGQHVAFKIYEKRKKKYEITTSIDQEICKKNT